MHIKIFYPAQTLESMESIEANQDYPPADPQEAPFPVVIFFSGFKCGMEMYQWLAVKLAERGLVVVTFSWLQEYMPGKITLTPGINAAMWKPDTYGTGPSSSTLSTLLTELEALQSIEPLAGMLDLERIILGGHSLGGRMAIENADPRFFSQVTAAFSYAATAAAPVMLGHEPNKILPLPDSLPLLLMGGTCDGSLAKLSASYGFQGDATITLRRTFSEAIAGGRNDSYLLILEGANHFTISDLFDPTQIWLADLPATQPEPELRSLMAEAIGLFIDACARQKPEASEELRQLLDAVNPLIKSWDVK